LAPGESKEMMVIMGIGQAEDEGKKAVEEFKDLSKTHKEIDRLKNYWHNRLKGMTVETPDSEFNSMMNMWSPYNCLMTYAWSRAASLIYAGERDGLGYRDTVQDLLGVLHTIPEEAGERLELMITGQSVTGGAMPVVKPFDHHPGKEKSPEESEYRSDDSLWLFNTVPAYVKETGDLAFYDKVLPYSDKGEDTVLGHLRRAIEFSLDCSGNHNFPFGLAADWNDCLQLGHKGESIFVAFQLRYGLKTYIEISEMLGKTEEVSWGREQLKALDKNLQKHAWDGQWFLRAFREDGFKFGASESDEGSIFLNPQTWAVYSGHISNEEARELMDVVHDRLATEYGLMICDPPFEKTDLELVKATLFNKGMKENGAIFCHTQGWAVIAEAMIGNGDRAYRYFRSYMPAAFNTRAELREIEPYVYCQFINSKYSPRFGASRLPWLSGSATWSYYAATQYILGIQPEYDGIRIDPCVPSEWKKWIVSRRFTSKMLNMTFHNPNGVMKGVREITLNGEKIEGNFIKNNLLKKENSVEIVMS
jgi:N,N'-diacetylchitobiose phosphorylase